MKEKGKLIESPESEAIERANQALTKLNNYAVVHSDVIDASWVIKVIEEVRGELTEAESPRSHQAINEELADLRTRWNAAERQAKSPQSVSNCQTIKVDVHAGYEVGSEVKPRNEPPEWTCPCGYGHNSSYSIRCLKCEKYREPRTGEGS